MSATLLHAQPADPGSLPARAEQWLGHLIEVPAAVLVVGEVLVLLAGVVMRSSSSVIAASRPRSANRCMLACRLEGTCPTMKWLSSPTPFSGAPWASSCFAMLYMPSLLAPRPSTL